MDIKKLFKGVHIQENVPLSKFSTLKIGGPAKYFLMPDTIKQAATIQTACYEYGIDLHVLSGGSNTLFSDDGFNGVVLKLSKAFDFIKQENDLSLTVGSACPFAKITKLSISKGFLFAVGWLGTPGLIGGAIRMNAGTKLGEIKDAISYVEGIWQGEVVTFEKKDIEFGYRKNNLPKDFIICRAGLYLAKDFLKPANDLLKIGQEYRLKRKSTQPTVNSLGSFFKNPDQSFAAKLIEICNLKGLEYNGAQISPLHANFIINKGGASANAILCIASIAQQRVFDKFGIKLVPEVRLVGNFFNTKWSIKV